MLQETGQTFAEVAQSRGVPVDQAREPETAGRAHPAQRAAPSTAAGRKRAETWKSESTSKWNDGRLAG